MTKQKITIANHNIFGLMVLPRTEAGRKGSSFYINTTATDACEALYFADSIEEIFAWVKSRGGYLGNHVQHPTLGRVRYGALEAA